MSIAVYPEMRKYHCHQTRYRERSDTKYVECEYAEAEYEYGEYERERATVAANEKYFIYALSPVLLVCPRAQNTCEGVDRYEFFR